MLFTDEQLNVSQDRMEEVVSWRNEDEYPKDFPPALTRQFSDDENELRKISGDKPPFFEYRDQDHNPELQGWKPGYVQVGYHKFITCAKHKVSPCTECMVDGIARDEQGFLYFKQTNFAIMYHACIRCTLEEYPDPTVWEDDQNKYLDELKKELLACPYLNEAEALDVTDYRSEDYNKSIIILHELAKILNISGRLNENSIKRVIGHGTVQNITMDEGRQSFALEFCTPSEQEPSTKIAMLQNEQEDTDAMEF